MKDSIVHQSVGYVDLPSQHGPLLNRISQSIRRVFEHGQFILGPEVFELEKALAQWLGVPYVVTVGSGTDALMLALKLRGVGPGDEVIAPSHSFVTTASAIHLLGARPVFADIKPTTMLLDPQSVAEKLSSLTRAIIAVHLYGSPCDLNALQRLCQKNNLILIEGCAQAFGARYAEKSVGSIGIGCFSFHPLKILSAAGDGGFLTLRDSDDVSWLRRMRNNGLHDRDHCTEISSNSRLDTIQAAVLLAKLPCVQQWIERRAEIAARYKAALSCHCELVSPTHESNSSPVYSSFVIRHRARDRIIECLNRRGVEAKVHYPIPIHRQSAFGELGPADLPVTDRTCREILSLPVHETLSDRQIEHVVRSLVDVLHSVELSE